MKTRTPLILSAAVLSLAGLAAIALFRSDAGAPAPQRAFQSRFQPVLTEAQIGSFKELPPVPLELPAREYPLPPAKPKTGKEPTR
ncbi:hypothetical protein QTI24_28400 [Variovorax sp. J22P240]|uniref:hypothetical protein n=1 Tax=Variovorax sp. J22P240 TaxID=3053514 RepID=UPI002576F249|nr:hypothetical protein [Variovorax sp. J22P240]MDM0002554.1 hypothetical protein [Variovorax sp. J22P240]